MPPFWKLNFKYYFSLRICLKFSHIHFSFISFLLQGQVCGLCGNYDGNSINDFTTRSQSVVENVLEFGNSWKVSSTCPDASSVKDPCSTNPYRKSWSEKQCSIINSNVFVACHSQVLPGQKFTVWKLSLWVVKGAILIGFNMHALFLNISLQTVPGKLQSEPPSMGQIYSPYL